MSKSKRNKSASDQLRFTDEQFIWRFSPNQTEPELLEAIFVGREPLLQNVLEKIADSAFTGSTHHVLLYGPRGIGKSHLTSLLHHRIERDEEFSDTVHVAWLNEDQTSTSMVQFLVRIYQALCKGYPDEYSSEWLDELLNQTPGEVADALTRRLITRFEQRKLVILVENLNLLFESLGKGGQHELRTLLQENPFACLIATSQQLFKAVTDRSEPFFGFFQPIALQPLSLDDAQDLLIKIANAKGHDDLSAFLQTPDGRGRVRAIHDLAGGNHRVYIVLSGFVTRESLDQLVAPFQKMADDLTPYYQERLRWISPLQRQIVELLCREHGTLNPKEIARRLLVDQRSVGKQVRELAQIGYLISAKRGRETFYELSEPLMRLAYEVKEQSLLEMLIDFLRIWYRPDELRELRSSGLCQSTLDYADAAWERSQTHPDPRLKLLRQEIEAAESEGRKLELAALWEELAAASNSARDWVRAGFYFGEHNRDHSHAIVCTTKAIEIDPSDPGAWSNMGWLQNCLGNCHDALSFFEKALEIDSSFLLAWVNKGNALSYRRQYLGALECFEKALEVDPKYALAWGGKGGTLSELGRLEEAFECFEQMLEFDSNQSRALNSKGVFLDRLGRYEESLACFNKAIEIDSEVSHARFNRGEAMFAMLRWQDGFDAIEDAFGNPGLDPGELGDAGTMFAHVFCLSNGEEQLRSNVAMFVDRYEQAAEERGFLGSKEDQQSLLSVNPLSHLADGLVKSLGKLKDKHVAATALESYQSAIDIRAADIREFEIALRLFRYGIRFLISGKESEFAELIKPERRIVRQALGLEDED